MDENNQTTGAKPTGRRTWVIAGTVAVLALGSICIAGAIRTGGGWGHHGFGGPGFHGGPFAERGLARALDAVDATAEQEKKIWAIIDAARSELRPTVREFHDSRETVVELLRAEPIDRAAAERVRTERITALDNASKRLTQAVLDAAEVLTPQQRADLVKRFQERAPYGW